MAKVKHNPKAPGVMDAPADPARELKKAGVWAYFDSLAYSQGYIQWIESAKKEETRLKRIGHAIEKLAQKT